MSICAADISTAFLHGKTKEKLYIIAGPEFGPECHGKKMVVDKSVYGLCTSSARFHEHLSRKLRKMGFQPSKADFDLWIKDCGTHYEYIAQYVDDLAVCSKDPMALIKELETTYELKGVGTPVYYLGGDVLELDDAWIKEGITMATSAETYIKNAVERYERETKQTFGVYFCPMSPDYHSEEDDSPLLGPKDSSLYHGMLGSANWAVTLGRFDCAFAVNNLARYSMAPREGHLQAMMHVFGYLKKFRKGKLLIDPSKPDHSAYEVQEHNWSEMYPDAEEELPPDMPKPKGKSMNITVWVDADHASDRVTH